MAKDRTVKKFDVPLRQEGPSACPGKAGIRWPFRGRLADVLRSGPSAAALGNTGATPLREGPRALRAWRRLPCRVIGFLLLPARTEVLIFCHRVLRPAV
jgi:hypothetical protein